MTVFSGLEDLVSSDPSPWYGLKIRVFEFDLSSVSNNIYEVHQTPLLPCADLQDRKNIYLK